MAAPEVEEMRQQAGRLRDFADDVEKLLNGVDGYAAKMEWSGPLTDRVRGEIRTWKGRCGDVAQRIRDEADRLDRSASDLSAKK
jgi:hypothetical protein